MNFSAYNQVNIFLISLNETITILPLTVKLSQHLSTVANLHEGVVDIKRSISFNNSIQNSKVVTVSSSAIIIAKRHWHERIHHATHILSIW